ncbi:MAG: type I 3-dehydroquinate dehydratase [Clostridia bacterium]|nr:type I 3-dehydroquinate dehydratase [Clostridia bacterium]
MSNVCVKGCCIGSGTPKICVPIVAQTMSDIFSQARGMQRKRFDIVEWRIDWFEKFRDLDTVRRASRILHGILDDQPFLFTFRTEKEGGKRPIDPEYYIELNKVAAEEHLVDMIDVELFSGDDVVEKLVNIAHRADMPIIVSSHDFEKTPSQEELVERMKHAESLGADILKIAVMPQNKSDVLTLLSATEQMSRESDCPLITMSMGKPGIISRLSGEIFGSAVTFGTIGMASAPGQIDLDSLNMVLDLLHNNI